MFETQEPKKSGQLLAKPLRLVVRIYATLSFPSFAGYTVQMATSADWKVTTIDPKESTHPCLNCKEIGFGKPLKSKRACSSVDTNHAVILKFDTPSIRHCWGTSLKKQTWYSWHQSRIFCGLGRSCNEAEPSFCVADFLPPCDWRGFPASSLSNSLKVWNHR